MSEKKISKGKPTTTKSATASSSSRSKSEKTKVSSKNLAPQCACTHHRPATFIATTTKKESNAFPQAQLTHWLQQRREWNHQDWLELLSSLEKEGFGHLTSNQPGREKIGSFLEANRR